MSDRLRGRLKQARQIQGVTADQLVERMAAVSDCRLQRNAIAKFETNNGKQRLTVDEVVAICDALFLDVPAFLDPDDERWKSTLREMI